MRDKTTATTTSGPSYAINEVALCLSLFSAAAI